jgi:hypothetical protein
MFVQKDLMGKITEESFINNLPESKIGYLRNLLKTLYKFIDKMTSGLRDKKAVRLSDKVKYVLTKIPDQLTIENIVTISEEEVVSKKSLKKFPAPIPINSPSGVIDAFNLSLINWLSDIKQYGNEWYSNEATRSIPVIVVENKEGFPKWINYQPGVIVINKSLIPIGVTKEDAELELSKIMIQHLSLTFFSESPKKFEMLYGENYNIKDVQIKVMETINGLYQGIFDIATFSEIESLYFLNVLSEIEKLTKRDNSLSAKQLTQKIIEIKERIQRSSSKNTGLLNKYEMILNALEQSGSITKECTV